MAVSIPLLLGAADAWAQPMRPGHEIAPPASPRNKGIPSGRSDSAQAFLPLAGASTDPTYGYAQKNPVKVGGARIGPIRERAYLNGLRGPQGQAIEYERQGSCCPFDTPHGFQGRGLLDVFIVGWEGGQAVTLYLDIYGESPLLAPAGFTPRAVPDTTR